MSGLRFEERQRLPAWIWAVVLLLFGLGAWMFGMFVPRVLLGRPVGDPAPDWVVWVLAPLIGVVFPAFLASMHLDTSVTDDALSVRFWPFPGRRIARGDVTVAEAVEYRPIRDCGGWGWRYSPKFGWCYTMAGTSGVRLELANGKKLMIGSRRADALAASLARDR